jgi:hypothetical protein
VPRESIGGGRDRVRRDGRMSTTIKRGSRWVSPMPVRLNTQALLRVSDQSGRVVRSEVLPAGTDAFSEESRGGLLHWVPERRVREFSERSRGGARIKRWWGIADCDVAWRSWKLYLHDAVLRLDQPRGGRRCRCQPLTLITSVGPSLDPLGRSGRRERGRGLARRSQTTTTRNTSASSIPSWRARDMALGTIQ